MQSIMDFLSFKTFISPYILIICYFIGAVIIPITSILLVKWAKNKWIKSKYYSNLKNEILPPLKISQFIPLKIRLYSIIAAIILFISLEIMWRMLFEFLIAYLQIREALVSITNL
jgi:hypothetical protein